MEEYIEIPEEEIDESEYEDSGMEDSDWQTHKIQSSGQGSHKIWIRR